MKHLFALTALFLISCIALFAAKVPETALKVVVKNQFDKPVENAEVILDWMGARQIMKGGLKKKVHWEVHTNQEGLATFPPVPEGSVQLQVNKKNYQTYGAQVDLSGEKQTVDIKLQPPQNQYSAHPPLKPADPPKQ
jgi:hypothetical protein